MSDHDSSTPLPVNVAVGILVKPDGQVLMAQRPEGKPYAGYWEFPGGKVDAGETILSALVREFREELGIELNPNQAQPWCGCEYAYPHAHVRLHFFMCYGWQGEPRGMEGQQLSWQGRDWQVQPKVKPILPATIPLLQWLPVS